MYTDLKYKKTYEQNFAALINARTVTGVTYIFPISPVLFRADMTLPAYNEVYRPDA